MSIEYTLAPLPQTNRGEGIKLGKDPKGKNFVYTNGKSVFIRDIEVCRSCHFAIMLDGT